MKFIASKKLSDNSTLRLVIVWMLIAFILAMALSITAKGLEYGTTPSEWGNTVLGNTDMFIDPLTFNDLLLSVHTDLFGLIVTFILIASIAVRTSHSTTVKMGFFALSLVSLLLYPLALLTSSFTGTVGVTIAVGSFFLFHLLMIVGSIDLLIALIRRKF